MGWEGRTELHLEPVLGNYFLSSRYMYDSSVEDDALVAVVTAHLARKKVRPAGGLGCGVVEWTEIYFCYSIVGLDCIPTVKL